MISQRLYMAVHVRDDDDVDYDGMEDWERELLEAVHEPAGWREYALEVWGTEPREGEHWPNGHKPFFWPKTDVPYKSRSTAQRRVDIINYWGGNAVVLECTPVWETVAFANKRRADYRLMNRVAKKRAELAVLEAQLVGEVA